jgi:hypothetical protein
MHGPRIGFRQLVEKQLKAGGEGARPQVTWRVVWEIRQTVERNDWQGLGAAVAGWASWDEGLLTVLLPAIHLAEHIRRADTFLQGLSTTGDGAAVAAECRADVNAFRVLADWCEDHEMRAAAAEARHLYAVLHYFA